MRTIVIVLDKWEFEGKSGYRLTYLNPDLSSGSVSLPITSVVANENINKSFPAICDMEIFASTTKSGNKLSIASFKYDRSFNPAELFDSL